MKLHRIILLAVIGCCISFSSVAQKNYTKDADIAFASESYFGAISMYKKAYTKERNKAKKAEILFRIAECYRLIEDMQQAEVWFDKAIKANYPDPIAHLHYADALMKQAKYEEALKAYKAYKSKNPGDPRAEKGIESATQAQEWIDNPTRYVVENEVLMNSKQYDFSPAYADKKYESLMFTSTREGSTGSNSDSRTGESFSDLYYTKQDRKGKWSVPSLLNEAVNSEGNEGSATFNKRYNELYFTRCKVGKKESFTCQVLKSRKMGQNWDEPEDLKIVPDSFTIGHPSMSSDENYLFFSTDFDGGQGKKDIWMIKKEGEGRRAEFGKPINLGSEINTEGNEMFPFIADDGTLYFASDGHVGLGGLDIYKAEKIGDDKWGNVQNMKYPINSPSNDFGIIFEGTEDKGYLTSNRKGGKGGDDIYSFYSPPLIFALQGNVYNLKTDEPIEGATVALVGSDGTSVEAKTDATGFYQFEEKAPGERYILANTSYNMLVSKPKFLNAKGQETTVGVEQSTTFIVDFKLQPFEKNMRFPKVQYPYDEAILLINEEIQSDDSLDFLYQTLLDNPNITIELSAHTDCRGSDKYNEELSQRRAETCVNYLIEKGIPADRMTPKGYGEYQPMVIDGQEYTCDWIKKLPTKEEQEAAHQENRRTVFRVLREDYVAAEEGEEGDSEDGGEAPE